MSEAFTINSIVIKPETSNIQDPVKIVVDYNVKAKFSNWEWLIKYTVDVAAKRAIINLLKEKSDVGNIGKHTKEFNIEKISIEGISKKDLMNVGLVSICGMQDETEVISINIVSQIDKNEKGEITKTLINPLE